MHERVTTFAGALIALVVVYGLFFSRDESSVQPTLPVTIEHGDNGYFAFFDWLVSEKIPAYSLRERFSSLSGNAEIPDETGNILVTTMPYSLPMREAESAWLLDWISSGNTLLLLAAINDTPDWSLATNTPLLDDVETITDIKFVYINEEPDSPSQAAEEIEITPGTPISIFEGTGVQQEFHIVPRAGHPLMSGVTGMVAASDFETYVWRAEPNQPELILELATMQLSNTPIIWQRRYGSGQIIIVGSGTLLTNRMIAKGDNRKFVANLVRTHLGDGATMIFDDLHQGLSAIYDPEAFFSDTRLHYTFYFIIAFWLLYIVGSSNRLLVPQAESKPLRQSEFIEATGALINRHMSTSATGLWMYRSWFNELRGHMGMKLDGEPVWRELKALTTLDKKLLARLQRQHALVSDNRNINLIKLHNTIHQARKAIG